MNNFVIIESYYYAYYQDLHNNTACFMFYRVIDVVLKNAISLENM